METSVEIEPYSSGIFAEAVGETKAVEFIEPDFELYLFADAGPYFPLCAQIDEISGGRYHQLVVIEVEIVDEMGLEVELIAMPAKVSQRMFHLKTGRENRHIIRAAIAWYVAVDCIAV